MSETFLTGWWLRSLRRPATVGLVGSTLLTGCAEWREEEPTDNELVQNRDEFAVAMDSLELQRRNGWAVGVAPSDLESPHFSLRGASPVDIDGSMRWKNGFQTLPADLAPAQASLYPYYVPTLFQSLNDPSSSALRALMQPIHTQEMDVAFGKGRAILSLFAQVGWPKDTAIVVDLPGPEAIAVASAMSTSFEPVFAFGNWPHPLGVVPAHETLAASLFYAPLLERERARRAPGAPAVIVLDSNRLLPYEDDENQFDNRYLARLPSAQALRALGVTHLLYVTGDGDHTQELDDLNESFVELDQSGIDVRALAMSELLRSNEQPPVSAVGAEDDERADEESAMSEEVYDDGWFWASAGAGWWWYYGGTLGGHCHFWDHYRWHHATGRLAQIAAPSSLSMRTPTSYQYKPSVRATLFSGGQLHTAAITGAYRPSGFGAVSVHASRSTGQFTHVGGFGHSGRSGSLGRVSGWGGG